MKKLLYDYPVASPKFLWLIMMACIVGCSCVCNKDTAKSALHAKTAIANPASVHCIEKGGNLSIQKRADGGEYGICVFEGNEQCEEWAMMRGACPVGGQNISGYVTPAARYCVITGGTYTVTGQANTDSEQGTCTLASGETCDVWDYFNGKCPKK